MELANPIALALLALAVPVLVIERHSLRSLTRARRVISLALRLLVLVVVVVALADPRLVRNVDRLAVAYLLDASASIPPEERQRAVEWVREALVEKAPDDQAAVIVFGADPLVERGASVAAELPPLASEPDEGHTDLAAAMRLALGLLPSDAGRRIVVLSDGHETRGTARREARVAATAGVQVSVVPLDAGVGGELLMRSVEGPGLIREGEAFQVRVTVESSGSGQGRLHLLVDERVALTQAVDLHPGPNSFVLAHDPLPGGFHTLRVQLDPLDSGLDVRAENNEGTSYVMAVGQASVLLVEEKPEEGKFLADALRAGGIAVQVVGPNGLPAEVAGYRGYDGVVLANVPSPRLTAGQTGALRDAVQRLGVGLVVVGGEQSYGAGGYGRSPLADALPVKMERRSLRAQSAVALLLVIDTSGSMGSSVGGTSKMALARESAVRALDLLNDSDVAGVLAFEDQPSWVLRPTPLQDRATVQAAVSRLQPGGGTAIYPALAEATQTALGLNASVRHIVLLTDGISPGGDYYGLADRLRQNEVTLSTIAVGLDADQGLLRSLAESGNGRFYDGSDPFELPQLLVKETLEIGRAAIVEESFRPVAVGASPILEGLRPEALPPLRGYVATTPKPSAQVILTSPQLDPILVEWQYGLGRVVAWTSDAKNRWAPAWVEWSEAVPFWTRLIKRSFPSPQDQAFQTQVEVKEGVARVVVDAVGDGPSERAPRNFLPLRLEAIGPDGQETTAPLNQVAPGRYVAEVPASAVGAYLVRIGQEDAGAAPAQTVGFGVDYSPEYRQAGQNLDLLGDIARATGGEVLASPAESVRRDIRAQGGQPIWQWLASAAAVLFLGDVAARRLRGSAAAARRALRTARALGRRWQLVHALGAPRGRRPAAGDRPASAPLPLALAQRRQAVARSGAADKPRPAIRPAASHHLPAVRPPQRRPATPRPAAVAPGARPRVGAGDLGARLIQAKQRAGRTDT